MKRPVMLSIRGRQSYEGQEPDSIELVTEGTMEFRDGGWDIAYEESESDPDPLRAAALFHGVPTGIGA